MDENNSFVPKLTLEPNAAAQAAVEEAPVEEEKTEEAKPEIKPEKLDLSSLSPAEQAAVKEFSQQIDILNTEQVMNYGSAAQKNISEFSDAALNSVRTKDLGEVGEHLRMVRGEVEALVKPLCKVMQLLPDKAEQKIYHYHRSNEKNSTYAVDKFGQI